jgi:hypothetical protein
MSFNFIYNPLTNEKYSIFSYEGKSLLKQYIKDYQTGGMEQLQAIASKPFDKLKRQNSLGTELNRERDIYAQMLDHASTQAGINAVLKKAESKKTKNLSRNQITKEEKKCKTLKHHMEQAQTNYYTNCHKNTIQQNKEEHIKANKGIPTFTGF